MNVALGVDFALVNRNVDELIHLFQLATHAGIWTREEATRHHSRLESVRGKLDADFKELMDLRERANASLRSTQNANRCTKK